MKTAPYPFKELIDSAVDLGELSQGTATYILDLFEHTAEARAEAENAKLRLLLTAAHEALVIPHVVAAYVRNHGHHDYQVLESGIRSAIQTENDQPQPRSPRR